MRESNSHQRFWRPLSYHLTNPLYWQRAFHATCTVYFVISRLSTFFQINLRVTVQPSVIRRRIYACIRIRLLMCRCAERQSMRKTAAPAAVSTQCGFPNGAGWTVPYFSEGNLDFSLFQTYIIYCAVIRARFIRTAWSACTQSQGVVLVSTGILKMEKLSAGRCVKSQN